MNNSFKDLYKLFIRIKKMKWIKSKIKGYGGIGYTFEYLIGKPDERFPIPDYNGIEIKTIRRFNKGKIHLLNITPDGDFLFPMQRIIEKLGYPDKQYKEFKVFNMDFSCVEYTKIGYYKKAKLVLDRNEKKLNLIAYNDYGRNLQVNVSWSFDLLKERIYLKLKKLAIIEAETKTCYGEEYYYYKNISYYKFISFDTFLDLLENGIITVEIKIGIRKDGENLGKIKSRGANFSIKKDDIERLYKKIPLEYFQYQLL